MSKKLQQKDKDKMISHILSVITSHGLNTDFQEVFYWSEDLRGLVSDFSEGKIPSDTCKKCGCNEFLCGHNKR